MLAGAVCAGVMLTGCDENNLSTLVNDKLLPLGESKADAKITEMVADGTITADQAAKVRELYQKLKSKVDADKTITGGTDTPVVQ